jgi:hypothetical protein
MVLIQPYIFLFDNMACDSNSISIYKSIGYSTHQESDMHRKEIRLIFFVIVAY